MSSYTRQDRISNDIIREKVGVWRITCIVEKDNRISSKVVWAMC